MMVPTSDIWNLGGKCAVLQVEDNFCGGHCEVRV